MARGNPNDLPHRMNEIAARIKDYGRDAVLMAAGLTESTAKKTFAGNLPGDHPGPFGLRPHVREGRLRGSLTTVQNSSGIEFTVRVGTNVKYGVFVEKGTAPREIRPKRKRFLSWIGIDGKRIFARKVNHPGTRPHPFLLPSYGLGVKYLRDAMQTLRGRLAAGGPVSSPTMPAGMA